ncbi:unnamed protein product, partial [Prorocentrum cordatum]
SHFVSSPLWPPSRSRPRFACCKRRGVPPRWYGPSAQSRRLSCVPPARRSACRYGCCEPRGADYLFRRWRRWLRDGRDRLAECAEALEVQQPLRRPAGRQLFWPLDCMLIRVHHVRCLRPSRSVLLRGLFHGFAGGVDVQERLKATSSEQRRARGLGCLFPTSSSRPLNFLFAPPPPSPPGDGARFQYWARLVSRTRNLTQGALFQGGMGAPRSPRWDGSSMRLVSCLAAIGSCGAKETTQWTP